MMICPETYYEHNLKGKDKKQILSAIRGLKNEIGHLKNVMEHPDYGKTAIMHPSESVQISCIREYLERAKLALAEIGCSYTPSQAELKAIDFQENIENISKITFEIGGFFDGMTQYVLEVGATAVKFISTKFDMVLEEKNIDKSELLYGIERLYIGEWRKYYEPKRFGYCVLDGTQWSVLFEYDNSHKAVEFAGSNDYPYNFSEFIELFGLDDGMEIEEDED